MRKRMWINSTCALAGLMLVGSAAATGCYVSANKNCCSILPVNSDKPNTIDWCQDQITANPVVPHYNDALLGTPGLDRKIAIAPGYTCAWDDYAPSGDDCLYVGSASATCFAVTVAGNPCTGTYVPP